MEDTDCLDAKNNLRRYFFAVYVAYSFNAPLLVLVPKLMVPAVERRERVCFPIELMACRLGPGPTVCAGVKREAVPRDTRDADRVWLRP